MKSHFVERLIDRSIGMEPTIHVRPAITPDVLPETFHQPIQTYLPLQLTPTVPSETEASARDLIDSTIQKPSLETKQGEISEDDSAGKISVEKGVTTARAQPEKGLKQENEKDVKYGVEAEVITSIQTVQGEEIEIRDTETITIEPEEVTTRLKAEEAKKEMKKAKIEEEVTDLQASRRYEDRSMATIRVSPQTMLSVVHESVSGEKISDEIKERGPPEKVARAHVPSKSTLIQDLPEVITDRPRPLDQVVAGFPDSYTMVDRRMQEGKGLEQVGDYSEPTVSINIERVEVRAIMPEKPPVKKNAIPTLSLEEYLERRREGGQ